MLISKGAAVNVKNEEGMTPLHAAVLAGDRDTVALLIAEGADVNARNKSGLTPLSTASEKDEQEIVQLLQRKMNQKRDDTQ